MKLSEQGLRKIITAFGIKNEVFFANKIKRIAQIEFEQDDFDSSVCLTINEALVVYQEMRSWHNDQSIEIQNMFNQKIARAIKNRQKVEDDCTRQC